MPVFDGEQAPALSELSALQLAYLGDAVYDLMVRGSLLKHNGRMQQMHLAAVSRVRASSQAAALEALLPHLKEEELLYVRKGRNAHPRHQAPRSATTADYSAATGLECLMGYLYVTGQEERLKELFDLSQTNENIGP